MNAAAAATTATTTTTTTNAANANATATTTTKNLSSTEWPHNILGSIILTLLRIYLYSSHQFHFSFFFKELLALLWLKEMF